MQELLLPEYAAVRRRSAGAVAVFAVFCVCLVLSAAVSLSVVATRVVCGGEYQTVVSFTRDPREILARTSFTLGAHDKVLLTQFSAGAPDSRIVIERHSDLRPAVKLIDFLQSDVLQGAVDKVTARANAEAQTKPFTVKIISDGKTQKLKVRGGSVDEALKTAGITLGNDDVVNLPLNTALEKKMVIRVQRVTYRETSETAPIDYEVEEMPTETLFLGEGEVLQQGIVGEHTTYYLEKSVDGKVADKLKLGEAVTRDPVPEIVLVGTKTGLIPKGSTRVSGLADRPAISELPATLDIPVDVNGKPVHYKQKIVGEATAYSGGGGTSTGKSVLPGRVAVDPREIPYGTRMYIVSTDGKYIYGYAEAQDTGGFIHTSDTVVDLYMHSESDCERFGRRNVEIYILE